MDKEGYINSILEKSNSRISSNWKDYPIKDYLAIFNNKTLHQIFETSQDIIDEGMMLDYFNDAASTIFLIEKLDLVSNHNVLEGFVVVGKFDPSPGDLTWPKWRDKKMPLNDNVCEIKLVAGKKGYGRIIFAWALLQVGKRKESAVVLEVIGSNYNQPAVEFYNSFELQQSVAYDLGKTQVRDEKGNIIYFMTKHKRDEEYLSETLLKSVLDFDKITQFLANRDQILADRMDEEEEPTYCVCKKPWDGLFMICCDSCNEWYHAGCVGLKEGEAKRLKTYKCKHCPVVIDDAADDTNPPDFDAVKAERVKQKAKANAKPKPGTYKPKMAKKPASQNNLITSYFNANNSASTKDEKKPFQPPLRFRPCKRQVQSNLITSYFQCQK